MFSFNKRGHAIVVVPLIISILMLIAVFTIISPSKASPSTLGEISAPQSSAKVSWHTECVDCGKRFYRLTNQSMKLDSNGYPHIAYGGDNLYYAWFDGATWQHETIDNEPGVGGNASLALDQSGNPHVIYHDLSHEALKYAYQDNSGWHTMLVDDNPGDVGIYTSIAIDSDDLPHITYYDLYNSMLRYAFYNGSSWQLDEIDKGGIYSNITLDSSDAPYVSYHNIETGELNYAYLDQTGWITQTLDSSSIATSFTSLAFDNNGYLHIGYFDRASGMLKYAYQDGIGWNLITLGESSGAGYYLSLQISPEGDPWMSYYDAVNGDLKIGHLEGSTWVSSAVDTVGNVGGYTSLQFTDAGNASIAYAELFCVDQACGAITLKLAEQNESEWVIQIIDFCNGSGGFTSLEMDSIGTLHLAYLFQQISDLHLGYAIRNQSGWTLSQLESTGQLGVIPQPSMALDSQDEPRFSYTLSTGSLEEGFTPIALIYAYPGVSDLITETVDTGVWNGLHSSIALDGEDYPHISYFDGGNQLLKYAFLDEGGWHTESVTETNLITDTGYTDLQLDLLGNPHIIYNQVGLRYAHKDQTGWYYALVDDSPGVNASSMAMDSNGVIHVAYQDTISNTLHYAYQDQGGWVSELIPGVLTNGFISLKLDSHNTPFIVYNSLPGNELMLIHLTGSGWVQEIVDNGREVGKYTSLVLGKDDSIYISYFDATNGDTRLAYRDFVSITYLPYLHK